MKKTKVLIVDDSLLIRQMFTKILNDDPEIEVLGSAEDPFEARDKIKLLNPDVITLDIEMPKMDGITFLKKIMALHPLPVVMVSSLTQRGADATIQALEIGAVDYVPKTTSTDFDTENLREELVRKVKNAAKIKVTQIRAEVTTKTIIKSDYKPIKFKNNVLVAIGASTGGVESLRDVLINIPANFPPIVITQHMPPKFTKSFADRLSKVCHINVKEAESGDLLEAGNAYIAPGGFHLEVIKRGNDMGCIVRNGENVTGHKPSVDVLFESVAKNIGNKAVGVILTGMGRDGAKGMVAMKQAGCFNFGQDEASSIVYGMPKAAFMAGAVDVQLPLNKVADELIKICTQ
jgi:two-component system, chemotaxis family, protein-glutamate methylesterase/glutaminase